MHIAFSFVNFRKIDKIHMVIYMGVRTIRHTFISWCNIILYGLMYIGLFLQLLSVGISRITVSKSDLKYNLYVF